jgi:hypothetical protein
MPRVCSVCSHDEAHAVNVALVQRDPYRNISERYGLSPASLSRHAQEHIPKLLTRAKAAAEVADADDLLSAVKGLKSRVEAALSKVEAAEEYDSFWRGARELRGCLELMGRITKELDERPTINLTLSPEWMELRGVIVGALGAHPEARGSVLRALEGGGNDHRA